MNNIALAQLFEANLMKIWKAGSLTSILENNALVQTFAGAEANEVKLPVMSMDGLGDYDKSSGYPSGDVVLSWVTKQLTQDRGKTFNIDSMDNLEAMALPMGNLLAEFQRTKVIPEVDAYRFAKIAQGALPGNRASGVINSADTAKAAFETANFTLDNTEVPRDNRVLFCSPLFYSYLKRAFDANRFYRTAEGNINREIEVLDGVQIVVVPTTRFYLGWQKTTNGYIPEGSQLNFILVHKDCAIPVIKHNPVRIWTPDQNQSADGYKFAMRLYHDCFVRPNREGGIYIHTVEAYTTETVDTPVITVTADNTAAVKFTVATPTAGASIYYTLDGSTPTTSSSQYSSQVTVADTTIQAPAVAAKTIKVIAVKNGMLASEVASKAIKVVGSGS